MSWPSRANVQYSQDNYYDNDDNESSLESDSESEIEPEIRMHFISATHLDQAQAEAQAPLPQHLLSSASGLNGAAEAFVPLLQHNTNTQVEDQDQAARPQHLAASASSLNGSAEEFVPLLQRDANTQADPFGLFSSGSGTQSETQGAAGETQEAAGGAIQEAAGANTERGSTMNMGMGGYVAGVGPGYAVSATYLMNGYPGTSVWPNHFAAGGDGAGSSASNQAVLNKWEARQGGGSRYEFRDSTRKNRITSYRKNNSGPVIIHPVRPLPAGSVNRLQPTPPIVNEAKQRIMAFRDAFHAAQDALLIPPTPTAPIPPVTRYIPLELWFRIVAQYLAPRVLTIISTEHDFQIFLAPSLERISPLLLVDIATRAEAMKTHTIAFGGLLSQPMLFNHKTDVLLFNHMGALQELTKKPRALELLRRANVQFLAVDFTRASLKQPVGQALLDEVDRNTIAEAVRMFGSIEKLFMLFRFNEPEEPRKNEAESWTNAAKAAIHNKFKKALPIWEAFESKGRTVNRWREPDVVEVVWDVDELLHLANQREKTDNDEKSGEVEGGEDSSSAELGAVQASATG